MEIKNLIDVFKDAASALKKGKHEAVREVLGAPYKAALNAEKDAATKKSAAALYENFWVASSDSAQKYVTSDHAEDILNMLSDVDANAGPKQGPGGLSSLSNPLQGFASAAKGPKEKMLFASKRLHDILHDVDVQRHELATEFTKNEASRFAEFTDNPDSLIGAARQHCGYTADLIKRRFSGDAELEEFSDVTVLDTAMKKAGAIALTAVGGGLVVHGARNAICAFRPETDEHLQVEELGQQQQQSGTNWLQLAVGVFEAVTGSAIMYRVLTGRMDAGPLEGHVDRLFNCNHSPSPVSPAHG